MGRNCTICSHPRGVEINKMLHDGVPLRKIAEQFGVSSGSLHRHKTCIVEGSIPPAPSILEPVILPDIPATLENQDISPHTAGIIANLRQARDVLKQGFLAVSTNEDGERVVQVNANAIERYCNICEMELRAVDRHRKDPPPQTAVQINLGGQILDSADPDAAILGFQGHLEDIVDGCPRCMVRAAEKLENLANKANSNPGRGTKKKRQAIDITPEERDGF